MKKYFFLILIFISTASTADWEVSGANNDENITWYADRTTIKKNGNIVTMWTMTSGKPSFVNNKQYLSSKNLFEFDCKNEKIRLLSGTAYSEENGMGEVVHMVTYKENETQSIFRVPGTLLENQWKIACRKK